LERDGYGELEDRVSLWEERCSGRGLCGLPL